MSEFDRHRYEKFSAFDGFRREQVLLFPSSDSEKRREIGYLRLLVEGYVEGRPGKIFTVNNLANEVECDPKICYGILEVLESNGLVERLVERGKGKRGKIGRFKSLAPELEETCSGIIYESQVDREILEDYYYTIERGIQEKKARGKPSVRSV